jgi:hypothetical protein
LGTDHLVHLLTVLEDDEGGHGTNAKLLSKIGDGVDIELDKVDLVLVSGVL